MAQELTNNDNALLNQRSNFEVGETLEELELNMSEDELKKMIKKWMSITSTLESVLKTNGEINKQYYKGIDSRTEDIMDNKSKVIDNRIFTDIETIVPLVTSRPAKPIVTIPKALGKGKEAKDIRKQSIKNQKILLAIYEDQKLQHKYEKMIRQHQIWHIGVVRYGLKDDKIFADVKLPSRLLLDGEATNIEDSDFVGEKIVDTASNLIGLYPDKESEILSYISNKRGTKITYIEWWTDDMKIVSIGNEVILESIKNPYFDYTGIPKQETDEFGKKIEGEPTMNNFFDRPRKPYIRMSIYNIGESILDDTTALELCKSLQDNINDRKRQIADNTDVTGNPIRAYRGMNSDQASEADANLSAGDGVNLGEEQGIEYVQAAPLPAYIQNDLQDSRNAIDNIFGIHSTTRGERIGGANESGRAREALREGDEDRQATIGRALEEVSEELYNAFAHLIKVFYDEDQVLPILGSKGANEYVEFKRDDIMDGMTIRVKPGSTIPQDPNAQRAQAIELLSLNAISKRKAYEMMGIEDVDEAVEQLEQEAVKAEVESQKLLEKQQAEKAKEGLKQGFQEQIAQIGQPSQTQ